MTSKLQTWHHLGKKKASKGIRFIAKKHYYSDLKNIAISLFVLRLGVNHSNQPVESCFELSLMRTEKCPNELAKSTLTCWELMILSICETSLSAAHLVVQKKKTSALCCPLVVDLFSRQLWCRESGVVSLSRWFHRKQMSPLTVAELQMTCVAVVQNMLSDVLSDLVSALNIL